MNLFEELGIKDLTEQTTNNNIIIEDTIDTKNKIGDIIRFDSENLNLPMFAKIENKQLVLRKPLTYDIFVKINNQYIPLFR